MNEKELLSLTKEATVGFEKKLSMTSYDKIGTASDNEVFEAHEGIENFVTTFMNHCIRFDMDELLHEFPLLDLSPICLRIGTVSEMQRRFPSIP